MAPPAHPRTPTPFGWLLLAAGLAACGGDPSARNTPPAVQILQPAAPVDLAFDEPLVLQADILDAEDGALSGAAVTWTSDRDGALGTGATLEVSHLSFGLHTITVLATDPDGLGGMDTVQVRVTPHRTVARWLTGHFSSAQQAREDPSYFDITLHMARIWPDRGDGLWLYVEQAVTGSAPYRQRVYRLFEQDGEVQDEIYELPNAGAVVGAWADPTTFDGLTPTQLTLKPGCEVTFTWTGERFEGGTSGAHCLSDHNGATYATTDIELSASALSSWDIGWDAADQQVWGPTAGPYRFDKLEDYPLE